MKKHNLMGKLLTATLAASMAISPAMAYAATTNDALSGTKGTDNASSEKNDLNDHDVIDKDATGKITISINHRFQRNYRLFYFIF